jgi:copper chaperone CopZ
MRLGLSSHHYESCKLSECFTQITNLDIFHPCCGKRKQANQKPIIETKKALIDVDGATCTSCVYTIEHVGNKLGGVVDCYVDRNTSQIQLEYDGRDETIEEIVKLVDKIGYNAVLNTKDIKEFSS